MAGKNFDLQMRTFKGDIDIFYEIFWKKVYFIPEEFVQSPKVIVDLGAHIGFTSIFFSLQYPRAKVYAIEASEKNYKLLGNNLQNFENVSAMNKAIYPKDGFINFDDDGALSYNTKISDAGTPIECVSMQTFMNENKIETIDLLKIDIEGAEAALLSEQNEWLHKVANIIIELHPPYNMENLSGDLKPFGFRFSLPGVETGLKNIFLSK